MAHSRLVSSLFEINGRSLTVMGLKGIPDKDDWIVGIPIEPGKYVLVQITPEPILPTVLNVIADDEAHGNLEMIRYLIISNRAAVYLWLEGVLNQENFTNVFEGKSVTPESEYIVLQGVKIANYKFDVIILPETVCFAMMVATLDEQFRVVGSEKDSEPVFMPEGNMFLLS